MDREAGHGWLRGCCDRCRGARAHRLRAAILSDGAPAFNQRSANIDGAPRRARLRSARCLAAPDLDGAFQIGQLLAGQQADLAQRAQMAFGCCDIAGQQIRLADVFVRATMARVKRDRLLVMLERQVEALQVAVGVAQVVVQVGIFGIADGSFLEAPRRFTPVFAVDGLLASSLIGIARGQVGVGFVRLGESRPRRRKEKCRQRSQRKCQRQSQHRQPASAWSLAIGERNHRLATKVRAAVTSGRAVSAFLASVSSCA